LNSIAVLAVAAVALVMLAGRVSRVRIISLVLGLGVAFGALPISQALLGFAAENQGGGADIAPEEIQLPSAGKAHSDSNRSGNSEAGASVFYREH
jgi:hypothetical protein